jgi:ribosomal protein L21E
LLSRKDRKYYLYKTRKTWTKKDRQDKWSLVVQRQIGTYGMVTSTKIEIRSSKLAQVIAEMFKNVTGQDLASSPPSVR